MIFDDYMVPEEYPTRSGTTMFEIERPAPKVGDNEDGYTTFDVEVVMDEGYPHLAVLWQGRECWEVGLTQDEKEAVIEQWDSYENE